MDVRSQPSSISSRDSFAIELHDSPPTMQPPRPISNMRLTFSSDSTNIYKQVPATSPSPSLSPFHGTPTTAGAAAGSPWSTCDGDLPGQTAAASSQYQGLHMNMGEPMKRKRGRPRKYGPDVTIAVVRSPGTAEGASASSAVQMVAPVSCVGFPSPVGPPKATATTSSAPSDGAMKKSGKRPGSMKKHQISASGPAGTPFTPHVMIVKAGEDVSSKVMSFLQHRPCAVCVLSANGAISNVTLRQASSGGTVTYEGRFEILSLSGSFLLSEIAGQLGRTGGLSISLAGPDGRVLGGGVAGLLTAASPIQVVIGRFNPDGKKDHKGLNLSDPAPIKRFSPLGNIGPSSPPSHGTQSESSGGAGSPRNKNPGGCNDGSQAAMPSMPWK